MDAIEQDLMRFDGTKAALRSAKHNITKVLDHYTDGPPYELGTDGVFWLQSALRDIEWALAHYDGVYPITPW